MHQRIFTVFNSQFHDCYRDIDYESGRCRISASIMSSYRIPMGSILHLRILEQNIDIGCTVWPDSLKIFAHDEMTADYSTLINNDSNKLGKVNSCQIIEVFPYKQCLSLHINTYGIHSDMKPHISSFLGLVVTKGGSIKVRRSVNWENIFSESNSSHDIFKILDTSPSNNQIMLVVGNETVLICTSQEFETQNPKPKYVFCQTKVVEEIINRVVMPSCLKNIPRSALPRGIMLLGSPGVGKTYAVKAVKEICRDKCDVNIFQLHIPSLLSDEDPIKMLEKIFQSIRDCRYRQRPLLQASSSLSAATTPINFNKTFIYKKQSSPVISPATPFKHQSPSNSTLSTPHKSNSKLAMSGMVREVSNVSFSQVSFLLIDEIDALGSATNQSEVQMAIKKSICHFLDDQNSYMGEETVPCVVVATSNRSEDIDAILRRGGRLEVEVVVVNTQADRSALLKELLVTSLGNCGKWTTNEIMHISEVIGEKTGGYVAADLVSLVREATSRVRLGGGEGGVLQALEESLKVVHPSCLRGVSINIPRMTFNDVIGYEEVKKSLRRVLSLSSPSPLFPLLGSPGGVLLHGPPGNCKTKLVMAAASEHGLPVISLSTADIYSPYVGN